MASQMLQRKGVNLVRSREPFEERQPRRHDLLLAARVETARHHEARSSSSERRAYSRKRRVRRRSARRSRPSETPEAKLLSPRACAADDRDQVLRSSRATIVGARPAPIASRVAGDRAKRRNVGDHRNHAGRHRLDQGVAAPLGVAAADKDIGAPLVIRHLVVLDSATSVTRALSSAEPRTRCRRLEAACRRRRPSRRVPPASCGSARSRPSSTVSGSLLVVSRRPRESAASRSAPIAVVLAPAPPAHRGARLDDLEDALIASTPAARHGPPAPRP